jgi:hypothetical protein
VRSAGGVETQRILTALHPREDGLPSGVRGGIGERCQARHELSGQPPVEAELPRVSAERDEQATVRQHRIRQGLVPGPILGPEPEGAAQLLDRDELLLIDGRLPQVERPAQERLIGRGHLERPLREVRVLDLPVHLRGHDPNQVLHAVGSRLGACDLRGDIPVLVGRGEVRAPALREGDARDGRRGVEHHREASAVDAQGVGAILHALTLSIAPIPAQREVAGCPVDQGLLQDGLVVIIQDLEVHDGRPCDGVVDARRIEDSISVGREVLRRA